MTYKSVQFCHAQANWIIRHTKKAVEIDFLNFHIFLTRPIAFEKQKKVH